MKVIYEPKGRAREYATLAANLYRGCVHGCLYCYAPGVLHMKKDEFHRRASVRENVLDNLERDAAFWAGFVGPVLLSFTTDPYQPLEEDSRLTREAISILNHHDIGVAILTKGGMLAARDFELLARHPRNSFAVTLTCETAEYSKHWEPNAAPPDERINSLRLAAEKGIPTWVSMEPVVDPVAVFNLIKKTHTFVGHYKVGKLNYHEHAKSINWSNFRRALIGVLQEHDCNFVLKQDLLEAA